MSTSPTMPDHFGSCPECGDSGRYINIGQGHWFYCERHRVRWFVGANLFSTWRLQTREKQEAAYDNLDFGSYRNIEQAS